MKTEESISEIMSKIVGMLILIAIMVPIIGWAVSLGWNEVMVYLGFKPLSWIQGMWMFILSTLLFRSHPSVRKEDK